MCGIVGYVGRQDGVPILLEGLQRLEYRGYDSAGIAVAKQRRRCASHKAQGKVRDLDAGLPKRFAGPGRHRPHPLGDPRRARATSTPTRTSTRPATSPSSTTASSRTPPRCAPAWRPRASRSPPRPTPRCSPT